MKIYAVSYNGKISQEAYSSLQSAQRFITPRLDFDTLRDLLDSENPTGWFSITDSKGNEYKIHELTIK